MTNWNEVYELEKGPRLDFDDFTLYHCVAMTCVSAIRRLNITPQNTFRMHILGASCIETEEILEKYRLLFQYLDGFVKSVFVDFIGPRIDTKYVEVQNTLKWKEMEIHASYNLAMYHDYYLSQHFVKPDLIFLPNAGIWVYDSWVETIDLTLGVPMIITSFAEQDGKWDEKYLEHQGVEFLWRSEANPFGSQKLVKNDNIESKSNSFWISVKKN